MDICKDLILEFSQYQKSIIGLGEIEEYIILLVVKHIIYKFLRENIIIKAE